MFVLEMEGIVELNDGGEICRGWRIFRKAPIAQRDNGAAGDGLQIREREAGIAEKFGGERRAASGVEFGRTGRLEMGEARKRIKCICNANGNVNDFDCVGGVDDAVPDERRIGVGERSSENWGGAVVVVFQ